MNFALSAEQELLRDTAREVLANAASLSIAQVRALNRLPDSGSDGAGPTHFSVASDLDDTQLWAQLASLGFLGLPFGGEHGGSEGSLMDLAVVLEEFGRAIGPPAYTQTVVLCGLALRDHAAKEVRDEWIPRIVEGSARLSLALADADGLDDPDTITTTARREGDTVVLDGVKRFVEEADRSDALLVVACEAGGGPPVLALVERGAPGVELRRQRTTAGGSVDEVRLASVRVPASRVVGDGDGTHGATALRSVLRLGTVAACLDMVGAATAVLEMAVAYAGERQQFGRKIGSFQAVQHHASNMAVDVEAARLITYQAAWKLAEGLDAELEVAMAKAWTSEAYRRVATLGHQIFGGIGLMREHDMHLYLRRSRRDELAFGDAPFHLDRIAEVLETRDTPWPQLRGVAL